MKKKSTEKTLSVSAIKDGTVIDHVAAGSALTIVHLLKLIEQQNKVTLGLNLSSRSLGRKDLLKIENRFLTEKEAQNIAIFAPQATINIIRGYQIQKKINAELPPIVEHILICPNPRCISRCEPVDSMFFVEEFKKQVQLRCKFCEKTFARDEIKQYKI
jgi:aspartate carbamoyltransferase regulatory subunit